MDWNSGILYSFINLIKYLLGVYYVQHILRTLNTVVEKTVFIFAFIEETVQWLRRASNKQSCARRPVRSLPARLRVRNHVSLTRKCTELQR